MPFRRGSSRTVLPLRGQRRKSAWSLGPGGPGVTSLTAVGSSLVGAGLVPTVEALTVVRIRGQLLIQANTAVGTQDHMTGAFGIGITQLPAFTAGIASLPTPITEADDENWLFHTFFAVAPPAGGETWGDSGSAMLRVEVDSKAMRKMATDKALYAAVEVEAENGTIELAVYFDSRVLFKLP